jgi:hypothetical protein
LGKIDPESETMLERAMTLVRRLLQEIAGVAGFFSALGARLFDL